MAKDAKTVMQILSGIGDVLDGLSGLAERGADLLESGLPSQRVAKMTCGWSIGNLSNSSARKDGPAHLEAPPRAARRRGAAYEVFDEGEFVRAIIELPGVVNNDIRFEVHGREVTVEARRYDGRCVQRVIVPAAVCAEQATSSYRNGMFEIQLPKRRPAGERANQGAADEPR